MKELVSQSCLTLWNSMDCGPPGSSVHGILQAKILEWVAILFSRGSSQHRNQTRVSHTSGRFFTIWDTDYTLIIIIKKLLSSRIFGVGFLGHKSAFSPGFLSAEYSSLFFFFLTNTCLLSIGFWEVSRWTWVQ